jgi:hypothetical protein
MKQISLIVAACAVLGSPPGFCQDRTVSVVNPSFELPAEPSGSDTVVQQGAGNSSAVPGWQIVSTGGLFGIFNDQGNLSNALVNQSGSQYLTDVSAPDGGYSGGGTVSQILSTSFAAGTEYVLTVWAGNIGGYPAQLGDSVFIANSSGTIFSATYLDAAPADGSLTQFVVPFTSTGLFGDTGSIEIGFTGPSQTGRSIMAIDDFQLDKFVLLPEPNSLTVAVFGSVASLIFLFGVQRKSLFKQGGRSRRR